MTNVIIAFVSIVNGVLGSEPGRTQWKPTRLATASGAVLAAALIRRRYLRWGATDVEGVLGLPGDEFLPVADVVVTRAIPIQAAVEDIWPWIAQLGQARGGFYSYDVLENLVRCDIHSADRVHSDWQDLSVGNEINLAPQVPLSVATVEPGRALVLRGSIPMGPIPTPYDFTWAFVIRSAPDGTSRLVVRERYWYTRRWAGLIVQPAELVSCVMSVRMLRGIKKRAEQTVPAPSISVGPQSNELVEHEMRDAVR
jgi:hypothetical protein